ANCGATTSCGWCCTARYRAVTASRPGWPATVGGTPTTRCAPSSPSSRPTETTRGVVPRVVLPRVPQPWVPQPRDGAGRVRRVCLLAVHTSPLEQPGTGDAGGMNVYVVETA